MTVLMASMQQTREATWLIIIFTLTGLITSKILSTKKHIFALSAPQLNRI
jgi:hypothetical protein